MVDSTGGFLLRSVSMRSTVGSTSYAVPSPPPPPPVPERSVRLTVTTDSLPDLADGVVTSGAVGFEINWGDGQEDVYASGETPGHQYAVSGTYTVLLTPDGAERFSALVTTAQWAISSIELGSSAILGGMTQTFLLSSVALQQSSVDALLLQISEVPGIDGELGIDFSGTEAAIPSPSSAAALDAILDAGVVVTLSCYIVDTMTVVFGGTGYSVADEGGLIGGVGMGDANAARYAVVTELAGVVLTLAVASAGSYFEVPVAPVSTDPDPGTGTGLTVSITSVVGVFSPPT